MSDSSSKQTFKNFTDPLLTADVLCYLAKGHYFGFVKRNKNKCPNCFTEYYNKHTCNNKRFSYVKAKLRQKDKQVRSLLTSFKEMKYNNQDEVFHYDFETFTNTYELHTPYIARYTIADIGFTYVAGDNCISELLDIILEYAEKLKERNPKATLYVNAFNGSKFDHYFFQNEFIKRKIKITPLINNGAIISMEYKNIKFWDMRKHTEGSLKKNLETLGCNVLKGDFDHSKGKRWEEIDEETKKECLIYLEKDVMGLKELHDN